MLATNAVCPPAANASPQQLPPSVALLAASENTSFLHCVARFVLYLCPLFLDDSFPFISVRHFAVFTF
jgi:hypothetical protein